MRRPWFATIAFVTGLGLIIQANNAHAKLEDILYEKGRITYEKWLKAKTDTDTVELLMAAFVDGRQRPAPPGLITCIL